MLLAVEPPAFILPTICPGVDSVAFFDTSRELPIVLNSIRVAVETVTSHMVVVPLAEVFFSVWPAVPAYALDDSIVPLPFVDCSICIGVLTLSVFVSHGVFAFILGTTSKGLDTVSMLVVVPPCTLVLSTVCSCINPEPISFVINPHPFINVTC